MLLTMPRSSGLIESTQQHKMLIRQRSEVQAARACCRRPYGLQRGPKKTHTVCEPTAPCARLWQNCTQCVTPAGCAFSLKAFWVTHSFGPTPAQPQTCHIRSSSVHRGSGLAAARSEIAGAFVSMLLLCELQTAPWAHWKLEAAWQEPVSGFCSCKRRAFSPFRQAHHSILSECSEREP